MKREEVKYIRDSAKSAYQKDTECYICKTSENLQFHHFYSLSLLWNKWKKEHKIVINSVDDILEQRQFFIDDHHNELYVETITLCKFHHMDRLHKIYGKIPTLGSVEKQKKWCEIQRDKIWQQKQK